MNFADRSRPARRARILLTAALLAPAWTIGCGGGGSGDEGSVDLTPGASADAKTGLNKESEARARKIAEDAGSKAR